MTQGDLFLLTIDPEGDSHTLCCSVLDPGPVGKAAHLHLHPLPGGGADRPGDVVALLH